MDADKSARLEKNILNLIMIANVGFFAIEVVAAFWTRSQAVLMDSLYDGIEAVVSVATIRILPLLARPTTEKHPYGYAPYESVLVVLKGIMLTVATVTLIIGNVNSILSGGSTIDYGPVACFELFAAAFSAVMFVVVFIANRKMRSPLVRAERSSWGIDFVSSIGLTVAFFVPVLFDLGQFDIILPYLDQGIAIILALFILPEPVRLFMKGLRDIFLMAPEKNVMTIIKLNTEIVMSDYDQNDLIFEVVRLGRKLWVSIYFKPKGDTVNVPEIAEMQSELEQRLIDEYESVEVEILPDIE